MHFFCNLILYSQLILIKSIELILVFAGTQTKIITIGKNECMCVHKYTVNGCLSFRIVTNFLRAITLYTYSPSAIYNRSCNTVFYQSQSQNMKYVSLDCINCGMHNMHMWQHRRRGVMVIFVLAGCAIKMDSSVVSSFGFITTNKYVHAISHLLKKTYSYKLCSHIIIYVLKLLINYLNSS